MNIIQSQKEILNAMLKGDRLAKFYIDEKSVFITPNGFYGFVFPVSTLQINVDRIATVNSICLHQIVCDDNQLKLTNELRESGHALLRVLKRESNEIYVNTKYLRWFQNPKFYQEKDKPQSAIVITECGSDEIVGVVMPVRIKSW